MTREFKIFLGVIAGLALLGTVFVTAAASYVYDNGLIVVSVREKGPDGVSFTIPVPVAVARAGLAFAPDDAMPGNCPDIAMWEPVVTAALEGLAESPDAVLVEVQDDDENVLIRKEGGRLVVDVDTPDEEVHVSVPLYEASKLVRTIMKKSHCHRGEAVVRVET